MTTLVIEAATDAGSVAVFRGDVLLADALLTLRLRGEERLMPAVAETLARAAVLPHQVRRIVCGGGPGGFTSLRIAASIAKGMSESLGADLWMASSLALVVAGCPATLASGAYLACLDAMRGEWYAQPFWVDESGFVSPTGERALLAREALADEGIRLGAQLVGPTMPMDATPHARGLPRLTPGALLGLVDHLSWEPDYGRLAEAQVKWEQRHGRALASEL